MDKININDLPIDDKKNIVKSRLGRYQSQYFEMKIDKKIMEKVQKETKKDLSKAIMLNDEKIKSIEVSFYSLAEEYYKLLGDNNER